jgi:uncharacterized Rmd1/YagE family protein
MLRSSLIARRCLPGKISISGYSSSVRAAQALPKFPHLTTTPIAPPIGGVPVDVRGYYIARGLDIRKLYHKNTVVEEYEKCSKHIDNKSVTLTLDSERNEHICVFNYGSVIFFNIPSDDRSKHLQLIKDHAMITPLANDTVITDTYKLMLHANMQGLPSILKAEHLNIRELDIHNLTIVATVMAQTVSLDHYANYVDDMLATFMTMNLKVEQMDASKSALKTLDKQHLYRLVASNNTVITNVLSKLGIFEGSDASWESAEYHYTWEALRNEFELDYRFKDLSLKLDIIKDNSRFFLSILNTEKGETLEWIIIILIAGEILLGITTLYIEHYEKKLEKVSQREMIMEVNQRRALNEATTVRGEAEIKVN